MSLNLVDLIRTGLSGNIPSQLASLIGASPDSTARALTSAVPALLSGLVNSTSTTSGATTLAALLNNGNHDGLISNIEGALAGPDARHDLLQAGTALLPHILGDRANAVTNLIGSSSGLTGTASTSLLGVTAPLVLGFVTRHLRGTGGVSGKSLTSLLQGQRSLIAAAAPPGLSEALGMAAPRASRIVTPEPMPVSAPSGGMNWLPWVIGLLALAVIIFLFRSCQTEKVSAPVAEAPPATAPAAASDSLTDLKLPDGSTIRAAADGVEAKLLAFITDANRAVDKTTWFTMDRLDFETGSATLRSTANAQLDNIAAILKAFPSVKLKLGGYTDNTGNAAGNLKLSGERAAGAVAALVSRGVDAARLESEGFGEQFPVADNATPEGRARNRRTDVRVTAK